MGGEHLKPCAPPVILLTSWGREIGGKLRETTAMSVPQLGGSMQRDWAVIHTRPQMQHTPVTNTLPKNIDLMYTLNCCLISVLCHVNDISHEQRTVCLKGNMCSCSSQRCQICYKIAPHLIMEPLITMNIQWKQITQCLGTFFTFSLAQRGGMLNY